MWNFYNKVIVVIKWSLDYELCLIAEVNFSQNLVTRVQYNLLPWPKFYADLAILSSKACLQFPCNKDFTISASQISSFDPPSSVSAPSRQVLCPSMLIVRSHQKETQYDEGNIQEHKTPNEW